MTNFTLPETYCAYCKDAAVQSAVDHILNRGKKLDVPPDLEWCRLPDLHAAVLGAHQVRCDFAIALHGLWIKVWQHALDHCGFADSLEPQSLYEQQQEGYAYPCDTYSLWDPGILERVYDAGDHKIGLGVCVATKQVWLAIRLLDGQENDLTANLTLGDDWVSELDDVGYLWSDDELARFSNDGCCIPLDPLNRAARQALEQIGGRLGKAAGNRRVAGTARRRRSPRRPTM